MIKSLLLAPAAALALLAPAAAQTDSDAGVAYKTGDPAGWPAELDAMIAAPGHHTVLMENDSVRVLEVSIAPGVVEPLHSHRWPSVLYIMTAGDFVDHDASGAVTFDTRALDAPLAFPLTMWKAPEAPHSVTNLSDTQEIRLIRVEIKDAPAP